MVLIAVTLNVGAGATLTADTNVNQCYSVENPCSKISKFCWQCL